MAKATAAKAKGVKAKANEASPPTVMVNANAESTELSQAFKVSDATSEAEIVRMDGMPGMRLEFDYVHFKKLADDFVAMLRPQNQKAYWLAFAEFDERDRRANIALHEIGVDPMTKILDRPRGRNNPLVRDGEKVQAILGPKWYVTWRVEGGEGDLTNALEVGFKVIRRPLKDKAKGIDEEKTKSPFEWSGERWKIPDGTADPTSGEQIANVMMVIERQIWDDNLKAMSMESHNRYSQVKQQFIEGAENISRDMLGGKEQVIITDLDSIREEEYYPGKKK